MNPQTNSALWAVFAIVGIIWFILGIISGVQTM